MELNVPACPLHGSEPRALRTHNFAGIVQVIEDLIGTVSGVGTTSFSRCPYGYSYNFEGVVRALEDLNLTVSGITTGGGGSASGVLAGSGINVTTSGNSYIISTNLRSEGSVDFYYSGNAGVISGSAAGGGGGASVTVSGAPGTDYSAGDLWFDTNQGRLFVYASGNGVADPDWYQTNAEAIVLKSEIAPSGTGENAPLRDGSIWFNTLMGSLFVYDATTSGWYESGPSRSFAYGPTAPAAVSADGAGWYDTVTSALLVWDGVQWTPV